LNTPDNLQIIKIDQKNVACQKCNIDILDISNAEYVGQFEDTPHYRKELYKCRGCQTLFWIQYDLMDVQGHIYQRIFSNDVNDPNYKWQDIWTPEQIKTIEDHLKACQICRDKPDNEMISEARFSDFLNRVRKTRKK
jgi:hypothetical protein